jgi:PAS domain S-box-containing protein
VLIVEAFADDALLVARELGRGGYDARFERVDTAEAMEAALDAEPWDVVVSNYRMPQFSAAEALALLCQKGLDLPFIVVSGKIGQEQAVALMKAGAHDYVDKGDLSRLALVIEREMRAVRGRYEKQRAEEALREAEDKYRSIFENATGGIFQTTLEGRLVTANPALARLLGYASPEELVSSVTDVARHVYADRERRKEFIAQVRREGLVSALEMRLLRKDGSTVWVSMNARALYDGRGKLAGFEGAVEDVTQRKEAEEALQDGEERFRSLLQHVSDIVTVLEADGTIRYESPSIERVMGYRPNELIGENVLDYVHPEDVTRVSCAVTEALRNPGMRSVAEAFRFRRADSSWCNLAAFVNNQLDDPSVEGLVITSRDVSEQERVQEELQRSEERYRGLVQHSSDIIMILEADGTTREESPAAERLLGFRPEERIGINFFDHLHPNDLERFRDIFDRLVNSSDTDFAAEYRVRDKAGRWRCFEARGNSLLHDPSVGGIVVTARDITQRKEAEEDLLRSEQRFRAAFEQAAVGIAHVDVDGSLLRVNERLCEIVDYEREELLGLTFRDITHPDDLDEDLDNISWTLTGEMGTCSVEKRYVRKDGSVVWVYSTVSPVSESSNGPSYFITVVEDISERKRTEEALRQSEGLYRAVVEGAAENIFLVDVETKHVVEANAAFHRSLGYAPEELRLLTLYEIVADDRESIDRNIQHILEEGSVHLGQRSYLRKDGSLVHVEVNVSTVLRDGREAMCVIAHDVTSRKRAEEDLRRSLGVLLALQEAGRTIGSTLESEEIISRLLEIMQRVMNLTAAVISLQDDNHGSVRVWRSVGLEGLWQRARYAPEASEARRVALEDEEQRYFLLKGGNGEESLAGLCLPLRTRDRVVGVLEAYGPQPFLGDEAVEILHSLASQAASALENARLYGELAEREHRLQDLVGRLLGAQEEERRRVAYEVHDGLTQVAAAAHQHLQAFARRYRPEAEKGSRDLERIVRLVRQTVSESRRIIANLRPTTLDDFGLAAAASLEVEQLREEGYVVEYKEEFGDTRLPAAAEIALFRVAQETLANVRKHSQARQVRIELRRSNEEVRLEIQDYGRGFDPAVAHSGGGPGERVGLAGMRERIGMLSGEFEVRSRPGAGTSVTATIPSSAFVEEESLGKGKDGR